MVKIENIVASVSVKTENVFQLAPENGEQNEKDKNSPFPSNTFNLCKFEAEAEKYSESKPCPIGESLNVNFRTDPKQESALEGLINPASLSNVPFNIKKAGKCATDVFVAPFYPANVVKVEKEKTTHTRSSSIGTERKEFSASSDTHDALIDVQNKSNVPPIHKLVKTEANPNFPKGSLLKRNRTYSAASLSLSSLGIKPCWVVIERVDVKRVNDNAHLMTCDNKTRTDAIQDEASCDRKSRCRVGCDSKAQNDSGHDNMTHAEMVSDKAHDNSMTRENAANFLKFEVASFVAPLLPVWPVKLEKEELFHPPSCEDNRVLSRDKMRNKAVFDNTIHGSNCFKRETSLLVAPASPDKCIKVEKKEFSSLPSSYGVFHDNRVCKNICDSENHDNNIAKREPSVLVAPFFPGGRIKVEKEEFSGLLLSSKVPYENMTCDDKIHDNNVVEREISALDGKENFSSFLASSEGSLTPFHDNKVHNTTCDRDNKIHDTNSLKCEIPTLVAPFFSDIRIKVEKGKELCCPSSAYQVYRDYKVDDNMISENKIHYSMICDNKTHDNNMPDNMICENKIHDNNMPDNMVCENKIHDSVICGNKTHDNNMPDNMICENKIHDSMVCDNKTHDNSMPDNMICEKKIHDSMICDNNMPDNMICENKIHDSMICDNKTHDKNMPHNMICENKIHDSMICDNNMPDNMICENDIHDNIFLDNKIFDNKVNDTLICDNNSVECEATHVVPYFSNSRSETDEEEESSGLYSSEVPHDNKLLDICENKDPANMVCAIAPDVSGFRCERCRSSFTRKKYLKTHIDYHCEGPPLAVKNVASHAGADASHGYASRSLRRAEGLAEKRPHSSEVPHGNDIRENKDPANKVCAIAPDVSGFRCERCRSSFTRKEYLKRHIDYHCEGPPLAVKNVASHAGADAGHGYASRSLRRADGLAEKRPQCTDCGKYFSRPDVLKKHAKRAHATPKVKKATASKEPKIINCGHCDKYFPSKSSLQSHLLYFRKSSQSQRVCTTCKASFQDSYSYNRHMRWGHARSGGKVGKCEGCGKVFARFSDLSKHLKRPGINNAEFFALVPAGALDQLACTLCNRAFAKHEFLKCHLLRRLQKPAQACRLCCAVFEDPENLSEHMGTVHQRKAEGAVGGKPMPAVVYTCQHCGKSFRVKGFLKNHIFQRCAFVGKSGGF